MLFKSLYSHVTADQTLLHIQLTDARDVRQACLSYASQDAYAADKDDGALSA